MEEKISKLDKSELFLLNELCNEYKDSFAEWLDYTDYEDTYVLHVCLVEIAKKFGLYQKISTDYMGRPAFYPEDLVELMAKEDGSTFSYYSAAKTNLGITAEDFLYDLFKREGAKIDRETVFLASFFINEINDFIGIEDDLVRLINNSYIGEDFSDEELEKISLLQQELNSLSKREYKALRNQNLRNILNFLEFPIEILQNEKTSTVDTLVSEVIQGFLFSANEYGTGSYYSMLIMDNKKLSRLKRVCPSIYALIMQAGIIGPREVRNGKYASHSIVSGKGYTFLGITWDTSVEAYDAPTLWDILHPLTLPAFQALLSI